MNQKCEHSPNPGFFALNKTVAFLLSLFAFASTCEAQQTEKNGLPCVAEICLGDGLAELSKVQWNRATSWPTPLAITTKISPRDKELVRAQFKGNVDEAAIFLYHQSFDSTALNALARVTTACSANALHGTYTSQGGNPTWVVIALTPDLSRDIGSTEQKWTVVSIGREFPKAVSEQQKAEIDAELVKRYHAFGAENLEIKNAKPGEGRFAHAYGKFGFDLSMFRGTDETDRVKHHPQCGGSTKIKID